jgi:hypothetical protein
MTAIKKTSKTSTKSPAPATSSTKPAKRTVKKPTAVGSNGGAHPAPAAPIMPPPAPVPAGPVPVVKPVAGKSTVATITARVDIGFGNALFLRGEGPGLSWDKGVSMECVASDQWQFSLGESTRSFAVKFLINDTTWSTGPDYIVPPGVNVTLAPQF